MSEIIATSDDGTILYKRLTSKYLKETCTVIQKTLFTIGNLCRTLGIPNDPEALAELEQIPAEAAKDGVSIIAVDKDTDKVAGVCINKFLIKDELFFATFRPVFKNPKALQLVEYVNNIDDTCDIFKHCHINCVMEILFLGTSPDYQKKGIAKRMCELSMELAQKLRDGNNVKIPINGEKLELEPVPEAVYAIFTSFISQKIGKDLGLEIAVRKSLEQVEVMGQVMKNAGDTPEVTVEYKLLHKSKRN